MKVLAFIACLMVFTSAIHIRQPVKIPEDSPLRASLEYLHEFLQCLTVEELHMLADALFIEYDANDDGELDSAEAADFAYEHLYVFDEPILTAIENFIDTEFGGSVNNQ